MSVDQASPLIPIKPQPPLQNGFIKNSHNRASFCGATPSPTSSHTSFKTFAVNRKSWSGNVTLPLQPHLDNLSPAVKTPDLGSFKTFGSPGSGGTFPRNRSRLELERQRNASGILTPNGNSPALPGNETRRSSGSSNGRRYAEIGNWGRRSSTFLEPHLQGVGLKVNQRASRHSRASSSDSENCHDEPTTEDDEQSLLQQSSPRVSGRQKKSLHRDYSPKHKLITGEINANIETGFKAVNRNETDTNRFARNGTTRQSAFPGAENFSNEKPLKPREFFEKLQNGTMREKVNAQAQELGGNYDRPPDFTHPLSHAARLEHSDDLDGSAGESLSQSRESVSTEGEGARGDCSSVSTGSGRSDRPPCDIGLVERLVLTHPVWFLPGIQRAGAFHLLQGKEEGNFVVRQSSQADTMAISVRLPADKGPYVEHYLVQAACGRIGLETSQNRFVNIPELIAHYSQCCDELPVQLTLPRALREAKNRQQLSSLALLGQEFWRYPMANPRNPNQMSPNLPRHVPMAQTPSSDETGSSLSSNNIGKMEGSTMSRSDTDQNMDITGSGCKTLTTFKTRGVNSTAGVQPGHNNGFVRAPRPTPPNTLNLLSTTAHITQHPHTFPTAHSPPASLTKSTPPPPPPRWAKPPFAPTKVIQSPSATEFHNFSPPDKQSKLNLHNCHSQSSGNITVTTTVTFSVNNTQIHNHQINESVSDDRLQQLTMASNNYNNNNIMQTSGDDNENVSQSHLLKSLALGVQNISQRMSPEGECINSIAATLHGSFKRRFTQRDNTATQYNDLHSSKGPNTCLSPDQTGNSFTKSSSFTASNQIISPNGTNSVTSGIFSPTSQINSPVSNGTISSKSGIFSPVSQHTNKSEIFSPISRSSPVSGKNVFSPVSTNSSFTNNSLNSPLTGKDEEKVISLNTNTVSSTPSGRSRRSKHSLRKESRHYQESDILESPGIYCRSSLLDKISDYEDIWAENGNVNCTSFKPIRTEAGDNAGLMMSKRPDLLPDTLPKGMNIHQQTIEKDPSRAPISTPLEEHRLGIQNVKQSQPIEAVNETVATTNRKGELVPKRPDKLNIKRNMNKQLTDEVELSKSIREKKVEDVESAEEAISLNVSSFIVDDNETHTRGSPFYSDPVDAIQEVAEASPVCGVVAVQVGAVPAVQRRVWRASGTSGAGGGVAGTQRYSEPPHPYYPLRDMDSIEELSPSSPNTSASVDNLVSIRGSRAKVKVVQPPRVQRLHPSTAQHDPTWAVDSSWEFIGKHDEFYGEGGDGGAFPSLAEQESRLCDVDDHHQPLTIHHVLAERFPELRLSPVPLSARLEPSDLGGRTGATSGDSCDVRAARTSCYDNVSDSKRTNYVSSQASDDGTVFSEPWDSSRWDGILPATNHSSPPYNLEEDECGTSVAVECRPPLATLTRAKSFRDRLDPLLAPPRLRALRCSRSAGAPGAALRAYALHLAADKSTTFAQNIDNFIACTLDSKELCPQIVMRNIRQFMSGMKNYLVKHGEREFEKEVEKERLKLKENEFLNVDAILEGVMHRLVVRPLRARLYALLAAWHAADVRALANALRNAQHKTPLELGVKDAGTVPSPGAMAVISKHFLRMQEADSPLDKLECLLSAISAIFNSMKCSGAVGADELLPALVWCVARCGGGGVAAAELEAEVMAGLLPPALLAGEGGYYLAALASAAAVLKRFGEDTVPDDDTLQWRSQSLGSMSSLGSSGGGVVRVALPDECRGAIRRVALPCRAGARARDLARALAHAAHITNPQDYALFALLDGQETMLSENDCPQEFISEKAGKNCILAYKRIDAKIAWPQQALQSYP